MRHVSRFGGPGGERFGVDLREAGVVEVAEPRHRLECQFIDDAINDDAFIDDVFEGVGAGVVDAAVESNADTDAADADEDVDVVAAAFEEEEEDAALLLRPSELALVFDSECDTGA